jgi:cell division protein ZapA (FtsZ GTPase activity inhibitor)
MQDLSIKINIAGRTYPLTIKRDREELVRKAVKLIEDKIRDYGENYSVRDKQDLLAMCTLHFVNLFLELESKSNSIDSSLLDDLQKIDKMLDGYLKQV